MVRLCPTALLLSALAFASFGCAGQNVEGAWRGPFPIEGASDCRVRLFSDHRFDLACRQDPFWTGAGRFARTARGMEFRFEALVRRGEVVRDRPSPIALALDGRGNSMVLSSPDGARYEWHRVRL